MIEPLLKTSINRRALVMIGAELIAALGVWMFTRLPIDAVPDITNVQVIVNVEAPGYTPLEAEQRIAVPLETAMAGLPKLAYTRSLSRYGLAPGAWPTCARAVPAWPRCRSSAPEMSRVRMSLVMVREGPGPSSPAAARCRGA